MRQSGRLTREHVDVIGMVARGWTDQRIAQALYISPSTVWRRVKEAMSFLGASSRAELILRAVETGLLHVSVSIDEDMAEEDPPTACPHCALALGA